jgi:pimeloyl-ACP methyl ester carboxylesterase
MAYKQFVPLTNMNFQINRVLAHGDASCQERELWEIAPRIAAFDFQAWYREWHVLAHRAESEGRWMHAAYYHRMSEFFLPDHVSEKESSYADFRRCFYRAVEGRAIDRFEVPYEGGTLPAIRLKARDEKGVVVLHGGYDSFMEEFYLEQRKLPDAGYTVILFEGPGQGRALRDGLKMTHEWEKPVSAVLDYFHLEQVALIGVSLGGYLALRAAAFEPRITHVVAYDVVWDALACFARNVPAPVRDGFLQMIHSGQQEEINGMVNETRKRDDLMDWAVTHGMYITGAATPFDYLRVMSRFTTRDISPLVRQDVLLLAGENDHFVPLEFYYKQREALVNARSVRGRVFTAAEGGEQHCQVGNVELVNDEILGWLNVFHPGVSMPRTEGGGSHPPPSQP